MTHQQILLADPAERAETLTDIRALPLDVLPIGAAREALEALAAGGADVSVYQPVAAGWRIWIRPACSDWEGRMTPAEWRGVYDLAVSSPSKEAAVQSLARYHAALWRRGWQTDSSGGWLRPEGLTDVEQALSYLRWWLIVSSPANPTEGEQRFRRLFREATTTREALEAEQGGIA